MKPDSWLGLNPQRSLPCSLGVVLTSVNHAFLIAGPTLFTDACLLCRPSTPGAQGGAPFLCGFAPGVQHRADAQQVL